MRVLVPLLLGVLLGHLLYPSEAPETVRAAIPDSREGGMPLQFEPSPDLSDVGDSDELVVQVQGRMGDSVGWGVAEEPARPPFSADVAQVGRAPGRNPGDSGSRPDGGTTLSAQQITGLALYVSDDAAFAAFITPVTPCESTNQPWREGKAGERGLTMMHPIHRPELAELGDGFEWERQYEPEVNLRSAYWLWLRDDEGPWESTRRCWG